MVNTESEEELITMEMLITKTIDSIQKTEGVDNRLLNILSTHVLTDTPGDSAVDNTVSAIEELARKRAEIPGDVTDHN